MKKSSSNKERKREGGRLISRRATLLHFLLSSLPDVYLEAHYAVLLGDPIKANRPRQQLQSEESATSRSIAVEIIRSL